MAKFVIQMPEGWKPPKKPGLDSPCSPYCPFINSYNEDEQESCDPYTCVFRNSVPYTEQESLAELADRKGRHIEWIAKRSEGIWEIWFNDYHDDCIGHTYSAAEEQARAYLSALPDIGRE